MYQLYQSPSISLYLSLSPLITGMAQVGPVPKMDLNVVLARKDMRNFPKPTNKSIKRVFQWKQHWKQSYLLQLKLLHHQVIAMKVAKDRTGSHEVGPGCKVRTFWEAHIIWKNLPHGFDVCYIKSADLSKHEEEFFKFCVFLRKSEL